VVVLQEEHLGRPVGVGEHHRLVHVALARCAVAVVDDDGLVAVRIARAAALVEDEAHAEAGRVQRLRAEDERVDATLPFFGSVGSQPPCVRPRITRMMSIGSTPRAVATTCSR
jgi:hypothetical protein